MTVSKPSERPSVGLSPTQKLQEPHEGSLVMRASCCQPSSGQWEHGVCGGDVEEMCQERATCHCSIAPAKRQHPARASAAAPTRLRPWRAACRHHHGFFLGGLESFWWNFSFPCSRCSALSDCRTPKWPLHPSQGTQSIPQGWSPSSAPQAQPGSLQLPAR